MEGLPTTTVNESPGRQNITFRVYALHVIFQLLKLNGDVNLKEWGGDAAKLGDIWYDRATRESEAILDQWRRENPERTRGM